MLMVLMGKIMTRLPVLFFSVCHITVDQRKESLYWVSCDQKSLGTTSAGGLPQQLYRTERNIREFYLDWVRGGVIWLEDDRVFSMSETGGKAKELLQLSGGVRGNMAFDLRANSLLWNSESSGRLFHIQCDLIFSVMTQLYFHDRQN